MPRVWIIPMLGSLLILLSSCGSFTPAEARGREEAPDLGKFPPDFAVSVTLLLPGNAAEPGAPAWVTPAWYVVEADGRLRAREGVRTLASSLPPLVRQLRHEEVAQLWSTVRAGGLVSGQDADLTDAVSVVAGVSEIPRAGVVRPTAALYVSSGGRRRGYLVDLTTTDAASGRTRDLTARLAELSGVGRVE
jgi:hypothetical protein